MVGIGGREDVWRRESEEGDLEWMSPRVMGEGKSELGDWERVVGWGSRKRGLANCRGFSTSNSFVNGGRLWVNIVGLSTGLRLVRTS